MLVSECFPVSCASISPSLLPQRHLRPSTVPYLFPASHASPAEPQLLGLLLASCAGPLLALSSPALLLLGLGHLTPVAGFELSRGNENGSSASWSGPRGRAAARWEGDPPSLELCCFYTKVLLLLLASSVLQLQGILLPTRQPGPSPPHRA